MRHVAVAYTPPASHELNETIRILCDIYPKAFFERGPMRQPLKLNILADIEAQNLSRLRGRNVSGAVAYYTSHYGYHKCCAQAGFRRLDLEGKPVGTVTPKEAESAVKEILRINELKNANPNHVDPHTIPLRDVGKLMENRVSGITTLRPVPLSQLNDDQIVSKAMKKLVRAQALINGDDSDGLQGLVVRPLIESAVADLQVLIRRLPAA